jgi:hypothetical protein
MARTYFTGIYICLDSANQSHNIWSFEYFIFVANFYEIANIDFNIKCGAITKITLLSVDTNCVQ